jgi:hypothetical protein
VFNFGHHLDPSKPKLDAGWRQAYEATMTRALHELKTRLGHLPPSHVISRTTSARYFLSGKGDWNTNSSQAGGLEANVDAKWEHYGGSTPSKFTRDLHGGHSIEL